MKLDCNNLIKLKNYNKLKFKDKSVTHLIVWGPKKCNLLMKHKIHGVYMSEREIKLNSKEPYLIVLLVTLSNKSCIVYN